MVVLLLVICGSPPQDSSENAETVVEFEPIEVVEKGLHPKIHQRMLKLLA